MNYPDLIWNLIELVLQKEKDMNQEIDKVKKHNQLNTDVHDKAL